MLNLPEPPKRMESFDISNTGKSDIVASMVVYSGTRPLKDVYKRQILKKVGEECTEVIIGGRKEDREETIYEIADLTYHVMVLMVQMGITLEDVTAELEKRHVIDHKVKQERMQ